MQAIENQETNQPSVEIAPVLSKRKQSDYAAKDSQLIAATTAVRDLQNTQLAAAEAMALQLGYEGGLEVGALEDGIRCYQP